MDERNLSIISKKCSLPWPMSLLGCRLSKGILIWEMHSPPKLYNNHFYILLLTVVNEEVKQIELSSSPVGWLSVMGLCWGLWVTWHMCLSGSKTSLPKLIRPHLPPPPPLSSLWAPHPMLCGSSWPLVNSAVFFPLSLLLKHLHPKASARWEVRLPTHSRKPKCLNC